MNPDQQPGGPPRDELQPQIVLQPKNHVEWRPNWHIVTIEDGNNM
jgi:hypothetical protein